MKIKRFVISELVIIAPLLWVVYPSFTNPDLFLYSYGGVLVTLVFILGTSANIVLSMSGR